MNQEKKSKKVVIGIGTVFLVVTILGALQFTYVFFFDVYTSFFDVIDHAVYSWSKDTQQLILKLPRCDATAEAKELGRTAVEVGDPSSCLSLAERTYCRFKYGKGDGMMDNLWHVTHESPRAACLGVYVDTLPNVELCQKFEEAGGDSYNAVEWCFLDVAEATGEIDTCNSLADEYYVEVCRAVLSGDIQYCIDLQVLSSGFPVEKNQTDQHLLLQAKNECISKIAEYQRDSSYCDLLIEFDSEHTELFDGYREDCLNAAEKSSNEFTWY